MKVKGPGRKRLEDRAHSKQIAERLHELVQKDFDGNRSRFEKRLGVPHSTAVRWFDRKHPRTPDTPSLVDMAKKLGLSSNWVLYGQGPEMLEASRTLKALKTDLRDAIVSVLRADHNATDQEIQDVVPSGGALLSWIQLDIGASLNQRRRRLRVFPAQGEEEATSGRSATRAPADFGWLIRRALERWSL